MLTPMEVQYLTGICCFRRHPDAVQIILGDFVEDVAANENRDVDVTVKYIDETGATQAFMGFEVKKKTKRFLGTPQVEQLIAKMEDMPEITKKGIVSGTGFSKPAINKAKSHGVDLFTLTSWTTPVSSDIQGMNLDGPPAQSLLFGVKSVNFGNLSVGLNLQVPQMDFQGLETSDETPLFDSSNATHPAFPTLGVLVKRARDKLTDELHHSPELMAQQYAPSQIHPNLRSDGPVGSPIVINRMFQLPENIFLRFHERLIGFNQFLIQGQAQFMRLRIRGESFIMRHVTTNAVFAGVSIARAPVGDGLLMAMSLAPSSSEVGLHPIQLTTSQQNQIRRLALRGGSKMNEKCNETSIVPKLTPRNISTSCKMNENGTAAIVSTGNPSKFEVLEVEFLV